MPEKGRGAPNLTGAEAQYPMSEFMELFGKVKKLDISFTIHAGECGNANNRTVSGTSMTGELVSGESA